MSSCAIRVGFIGARERTPIPAALREVLVIVAVRLSRLMRAVVWFVTQLQISQQRNDGLVSEDLEQRNLLVGERIDLGTSELEVNSERY